MDAFSFQEIHQSASFDYHPVAKRPVPSSPEETLFSMKFLEERYHKENMLIQAVSKGQIHKAEMFLHALPAKDLEPRTSDSLRNIKNYTIILNTLLRKAAENGAVHRFILTASPPLCSSGLKHSPPRKMLFPCKRDGSQVLSACQKSLHERLFPVNPKSPHTH